jgi:hypothetical protein
MSADTEPKDSAAVVGVQVVEGASLLLNFKLYLSQLGSVEF